MQQIFFVLCAVCPAWLNRANRVKQIMQKHRVQKRPEREVMHANVLKDAQCSKSCICHRRSCFLCFRKRSSTACVPSPCERCNQRTLFPGFMFFSFFFSCQSRLAICRQILTLNNYRNRSVQAISALPSG